MYVWLHLPQLKTTVIFIKTNLFFNKYLLLTFKKNHKIKPKKVLD